MSLFETVTVVLIFLCLTNATERIHICSKNENDTCPPGQFCKNGHCECGAEDAYPYFFKCRNYMNSLVLSGRCLTFDEKNNIVQTGMCPYVNKSMFSSPVPNISNLLNYIMCEKPFNRTGALCGKCLPGHYPLVYSYNMTCIPCPYTHWNWLRYIMAAYLPLTLFYLLILFFKINTTSSHLFPVVYYCQTIAMPILVQDVVNYVSFKAPSFLPLANTIIILYGIWNLDFFKPLYSNLCFNSSFLPALALHYAIPVYPLFLMLVSYLLIELYDRNYRIITALCSPIRRLFSFYRRHWDIRTSVVDAYATFFFLSTTKLLSISMSLLAPVRVYSLYENHINYTLGLYYAADIEYFGREHLPYAILAIGVMCLCFILPVLTLALYPFRCFQRFLALFPFRWFVLHTFMDSFHGCYKNGTEPGTRDYRWFVAVFFIARLLLFIIFFLPSRLYFATVVFTLLNSLLVLQPYNSSFHCLITATFMVIMTLLMLTIDGATDALSIGSTAANFNSISAVLACLPIIFAIANGLYWIYSRRKFSLRIMKWLKARRHGYTQINEVEALPHRIENSALYPRENLAHFTS